MLFALDTNIVVHYLRNQHIVRQRFSDAIMRGDDLIIPKVVDYEVRRGFRILCAPNKEEAYRVLTRETSWCGVAKMDEYSWERAEHVYAELYRKGLTIGEIDILIAAYCLESGCALVTENTKHFDHIDGLQIVNWAAPG